MQINESMHGSADVGELNDLANKRFEQSYRPNDTHSGVKFSELVYAKSCCKAYMVFSKYKFIPHQAE